MTDKENDDSKGTPDTTGSAPKGGESLNQVELRGGSRMALSTAYGLWDILQSMQRTEPDQFEALVAIVIDKRPLEDISKEALAGLRKRRALRKDSVMPELAAVLAAGHQKSTDDLPPLRYPFIHTESEPAGQIQKVLDEARKSFRLEIEEEKRRQDRGADSIRPR